MVVETMVSRSRNYASLLTRISSTLLRPFDSPSMVELGRMKARISKLLD
jgi:hypothetical protein